VQPAQPAKNFIAEPRVVVGVILEGLKILDDFLKRIREGQINAGQRPHQNQEKTPEPDSAVQVPVEELPVRSDIYIEAAAPARNTRPPDNEACDAQKRQQDRADAVHFTTSFAKQQVIVQGHGPNDKADHRRIRRAKIFSRVGIENVMDRVSAGIPA